MSGSAHTGSHSTESESVCLCVCVWGHVCMSVRVQMWIWGICSFFFFSISGDNGEKQDRGNENSFLSSAGYKGPGKTPLMIRAGLGWIAAFCWASIRNKQMQRWLVTAVSLLHFFTGVYWTVEWVATLICLSYYLSIINLKLAESMLLFGVAGDDILKILNYSWKQILKQRVTH